MVMIGLDRVFETVSGLFVALKQELANADLVEHGRVSRRGFQ